MKFNITPTILLALCASSYATPINNQDPAGIEARMATGPGIKDLDCGGAAFAKSNITAALTMARSGRQYGKYPSEYGNKDKEDGKPLFAEIKDRTYMEFPLTKPNTWRGNDEPGKYRIVYTKDDGKYRGSMYKTPGVGDIYKRCKNA